MNPAVFLLFCVVGGSLVHEEESSDYIHLEKNDFIPRTCLDYLQHGVLPTNGFYWLYDDEDKRYVAYCDLSSEPGSAWTLVTSWDIQVKTLPHFRSKAFLQNAPINHNTPNWYSYRQTLARMKSLRSHSTHWRATCSFKLYSVDYRDYLRGNFSDFDIMTFLGSGCFPVEYVNIREHVAGSGTTASFWQTKDSWFLHIDSSVSSCGFKPNAGAVSSEDNFGHYNNINTRSGKFRCTADPRDKTTQWWFGGYLVK